ncbi:MAG: ABC transporter substrate-binding protein [Clostridiales bacterium]|nr:ABC transporter substrate-binding protein [Clostridiales bacterium]
MLENPMGRAASGLRGRCLKGFCRWGHYCKERCWKDLCQWGRCFKDGYFKRLCLLCLCLLTAGLSACAGEKGGEGGPSGQPYYSFTDDGGRQIVLQEKPQKTAVLFSSFADVWKTAGGEIAVTVGESVERGFAGEQALLVDAGAGKTINNELLLESAPDFIICSADLEEQVGSAELMNQAGIPAAVFHVEQFSDYLRMLKICTDITGNLEAYETCGLQVQSQIDEALASARQRQGLEKKEILFIRAGSGYSATKAKTAADNFVCMMLKELGTYNIAEKAPVLLDGLSFEEVLSSQPDYIFLSTMGSEEAARAYMDGVLAQESWQGLEAVRQGAYAYLPKELFQYKPNARWAEAYRYLIDLLYP